MTGSGFLKGGLDPAHGANFSILSESVVRNSVRCLWVVVGFILKKQMIFGEVDMP